MMRKSTLTGLIFLFILASVSPLWAQSSSTVQYAYDSLGRLTTVVDPSGNVATYTYDAVGNLLSIARSTLPSPNALAILNFTPQQGGIGTTVTIQGQNFSTTPASNSVQFNATTATVTAATANSLTVTVPAGATTGPIKLTVGAATATSSSNFTVIPVPVVTSINPAFSLQGATISNFQVTGTNLSGATFAFAPAFVPPAVTPSNVTISPDGTSATMTLTLATSAIGSFTLLAGQASAGGRNMGVTMLTP